MIDKNLVFLQHFENLHEVQDPNIQGENLYSVGYFITILIGLLYNSNTTFILRITFQLCYENGELIFALKCTTHGHLIQTVINIFRHL